MQQQERFQSEMANLDVRAKTTEDELLRLQTELNHFSIAGHQSEPTTPPEYHNGFNTRSNRLSLASLTSPPSVTSMVGPRANRSSSQVVTSPFLASSSQLPSTSVPGSRRNSDEEEEDEYEKEIKNVNTRRTPGYVYALYSLVIALALEFFEFCGYAGLVSSACRGLTRYARTLLNHECFVPFGIFPSWCLPT